MPCSADPSSVSQVKHPSLIISKGSWALQLWDWQHPPYKALLPFAELFHFHFEWIDWTWYEQDGQKKRNMIVCSVLRRKCLGSFRVAIDSEKPESPSFYSPDDPASAPPCPMTCTFPVFLNCMYLLIPAQISLHPYINLGGALVLHFSYCYCSGLHS